MIILKAGFTKAVLTRRSEKSILVKMTRFCVFQRIFKIFSNFKKSETSNLLQVNFLEYRDHHTDHIACKIAFLLFFGPSNSSYFECPKNTKNAILRASMISVMIAILQKVDLQ